MTKVLYDLGTGVPGVRLATKADEGELFGLLSMLHAENAPFSMNRDKVIAGIRYATDRKGGIIFVIDHGQRVVATMGMCVATDWYSDDEYLLERWNYVHPDFRKSDYARKLLEQGKWAHEWFKARGEIKPFFCGINSLQRTEAKIRLYARHMPLIGAYFMYGETPRQAELVRQEMQAIAEVEKQHKRGAVRPVVETLIRVSQRGDDHVQ